MITAKLQKMVKMVAEDIRFIIPRKSYLLTWLVELEQSTPISEIKDQFLSLWVSDYCLHLYCYFHNILADMSSGLLQVFVELWNFTELRTTSFIESTWVVCSG